MIPDLIMENSCEDYHIGKYGWLRLNYIKEYKRGLYTELMIKGTLSKHLDEIEKDATSRINLIIKQLADAENVNDDLKEYNQLAWVQAMNNIKNRAEEIVFSNKALLSEWASVCFFTSFTIIIFSIITIITICSTY